MTNQIRIIYLNTDKEQNQIMQKKDRNWLSV